MGMSQIAIPVDHKIDIPSIPDQITMVSFSPRRRLLTASVNCALSLSLDGSASVSRPPNPKFLLFISSFSHTLLHFIHWVSDNSQFLKFLFLTNLGVMASDWSCNYVSVCGYLLFALILAWGSQSCYGFGTFGFDVHHRFSDPVKGILNVDDLPEKGTLKYYAAMAHRDRMFHGRRLASTDDQTPLTFFDGNEIFRISSLGHLYYAKVSVGTPSLSFLVALDTGSDLFWLPGCNCSSFVKGFELANGAETDFNIYSPSASTTSSKVPCNSTLCERQKQCPTTGNQCPYRVEYLPNSTSSTGLLVQDVLHLTTDDGQGQKDVEAWITFGCGQVQTGLLMAGVAPNGLFGLGMDNISVPSILAKAGLTPNSFSMCFGPDGLGRIDFGDEGSSDQGETPFNLRQSHPTYNVSITQVTVGETTTGLNFTAIFDSGTLFTYLNDPAYARISESFNAMVKETRLPADSSIPFEYCYALSSNQTHITIPAMNLIMKGGDQFALTYPIMLINVPGGNMYCLGLLKTGDVNIIGQNFMTGYRVVFDREKMILGWKASDCYGTDDSNTLAINPINNTTAVPLAVAVNPDATAGTPNDSQISGGSPPLSSHSSPLTHLACTLMMMAFILFLAIV